MELMAQSEFQYGPGQNILQITERIGNANDIIVTDGLFHLLQFLGQQIHTKATALLIGNGRGFNHGVSESAVEFSDELQRFRLFHGDVT